MSDTNSNSGAPAIGDGKPAVLSSADLLSADEVLLPAFDADGLAGPTGDVAATGAGVLLVADVLDGASSAALPDDGGFIFFDRLSMPGNTLVRVLLEGADQDQVYEMGASPASGLDLNSLLGLMMTPDGSTG